MTQSVLFRDRILEGFRSSYTRSSPPLFLYISTGGLEARGT